MNEDQASSLEAYEAYAAIYDDFHHRNDYEKWIGELLLPKFLDYGLKGPGSALDVACGTGRAFAPLLKRGWEIWGCDLSPAMVEIARRNYGDQVRLSVADMRRLPTFGKFDLVLIMNDAVNHLSTEDDLRQTMAGVAANLRPSGLAVFDCNTKGLFDRVFDASTSHTVERGGRRWTWQGLGWIDSSERTCRVRISGDSIDPFFIAERYFSQPEVEEALKANGLACRAVLGQRESDERVLLGERPDEERDEKLIYLACHDG